MSPAAAPNASYTPSAARKPSIKSFILGEWPFFVLYALAIVGVGLTDANAEWSGEYWQFLIPITGLMAIVLGWPAAPPERRTAMVVRQVLHWGAVLVVTRLLFMHSVTDFLNDEADGFVVIYVLGLASILSGIHWNWRMGVFGVFLVLSGVFLAYFEDLVLIVTAAAAVVGIVASLVWFFFAKKRHAPAR